LGIPEPMYSLIGEQITYGSHNTNDAFSEQSWVYVVRSFPATCLLYDDGNQRSHLLWWLMNISNVCHGHRAYSDQTLKQKAYSIMFSTESLCISCTIGNTIRIRMLHWLNVTLTLTLTVTQSHSQCCISCEVWLLIATKFFELTLTNGFIMRRKMYSDQKATFEAKVNTQFSALLVSKPCVSCSFVLSQDRNQNTSHESSFPSCLRETSVLSVSPTEILRVLPSGLPNGFSAQPRTWRGGNSKQSPAQAIPLWPAWHRLSEETLLSFLSKSQFSLDTFA
jgi:hypothetical protein